MGRCNIDSSATFDVLTRMSVRPDMHVVGILEGIICESAVYVTSFFTVVNLKCSSRKKSYNYFIRAIKHEIMPSIILFSV